MASISQTINNYIGGISQQPDEKKLPGQVVVAKNVLPDITEGLLKRPGGELIGSLSDNTDHLKNSNVNGRWFHYYRDEDEQYIGQINRNGKIKVWDCKTGDAMNVYYDSRKETELKAYLSHSNDENIQVLTLNDFTYITNRTKTTAMAETTSPAKPAEAFIELNKVEYGRQYGVNLYDADNADLQTVTTATRLSVTETVLGSDSLCPNVGTQIFNRTAGVNQKWQITGISTGVNPTDFLDTNTSTTYTLTYDNPSGSDITISTSLATGELKDIVEGWHQHANYDSLPFFIQYIGATEIHFVFKEIGVNAIDPSSHTVLLSNGTVSIGGSGPATADGTLANNVTGNITDSTTKKDLYFRLTTTGQAVPSDDVGADVTYSCRYTTTIDLLYGGSGWAVGDEFTVAMKNGLYTIKVEEISSSEVQAGLGLVRPTPTSFDAETVSTSETVLGDLSTAIIAANSTWDTWNETTGIGVKQIGNGLYIRRDVDTAFNINTPSKDLLNVFTDSVADIADLPSQCRHGYVVKVRNSEAEEDDYYVKFEGDNSKDGKGTWVECPEPNRKITFDPSTMPIKLVRQADKTFEVSQITWEDCLVGDTTTVPEPSFIGNTINRMLFWRNRMTLLSDEFVIMSQPGEYFNYWPKSAITYTANDVIDISASSTFPAILHDGIETNSGLILFSKTQQFLLTTDSDILTPITAKINAIATYNFNSTSNPISLGTTTGFLDNAGKYSRFWEMANVLREGEPIVIDQTKVVSNLLDKDINKISNSKENSIIFFSKKNSTVLYGFKYFNTSDKRLQSSWFTWEFNGKVIHHAVLDDALYVVIRNPDNNKDSLQKIAIKLDSDTNTIIDDRNNTDSSDDITYRIYLDSIYKLSSGLGTYDLSTDSTTFTTPEGFSSFENLKLYDNNTSSDDVGELIPISEASETKVVVDGDWSSRDSILGYTYDMEVKLPTIYKTIVSDANVNTDTTGSLVVHSVKLSFGANGTYTTTLDRKGKPSYTDTWESTPSDEYEANQVGIDNLTIRTIPAYENNHNLSISIKSSAPTPATLYSMSWEGDYTNKYYQRV